MADYANPTALVTPDWAQQHLTDPSVRFVEVDVDTTAYEQSHLPGAVGWNWTSQLSDGIRRDIASREDLQRAAVAPRASAPTPTSCSTATTTTGSPPGPTGSSSCTASSDVSLLNGGRKYWLDNGLPLRPWTCRRTPPRGHQLPEPDFALRAFRDDILPRLGDPGLALVDVRSPGRVQRRGHRAPGHDRDRPARRPHPGRRVRIPWAQTVTRGRHVQARRRAGGALRGQGRHGRTRTSSPTAASASARRHTWFVLHELLGYPQVRNYDGSWTEWGSMVDVPIEKSA